MKPIAHTAQFDAEYAKQQALYAELTFASKMLTRFPRGLMGMVPDDVKATPEFKQARAEYERIFQTVRRFNARFTKEYKRELAAQRSARYA